MNSLLLLEKESQAETKANNYEKVYAQRHNIPEHWIRVNPRLQLAAFLEWQIATEVLSVSDARRRYVKEYPESNRLAVPKTTIHEDGFHYQDHRYALGSVLNLIRPYVDSIREVNGLDWKEEYEKDLTE